MTDPATGPEGVANLGARARSRFAPGDLLEGRYRIVRFIAQGGFGAVYEADDCVLGERVGLKALLPEVARSPEALKRFKSEVQLARKVTHPNVCRVFDVAFQAGTVFLTMELLAGETLHQRIRRLGPLRVEEARSLVEQLVAGLAAAHAMGVVHRDFKSSNIILVQDKAQGGVRAVITDFGIARPWSDPNAAMVAEGRAGTPGFMAPEQVAGGEVGPAADIYALGVVLHHMLTGEMPSLGTPPPQLDSVWLRVIRRCLERDPARRFARVEAVASALGLPAAVSRRRRYALAAVALSLLGALAGWVALRIAKQPAAATPKASSPVESAPAKPATGEASRTTLDALDSMSHGDLAAAKRKLTEARNQARAARDPEAEAFATAVAAFLAKETGELERAAELYEQSSRLNGAGPLAAGGLAFWAELRVARDDLAGARALTEKALQLAPAPIYPVHAALAHMVQAEIALAEARARDAEALARAAAEGLAGVLPHHEIQSRTILAQALLALGRRHEARKQVQQALAQPGEMLPMRLRLELVAARLEPAAKARAEAERIATRARALGFLEVALEAGLALAESYDQLGQAQAARATRAGVVEEAQRAGYRRLARPWIGRARGL